MYTCTCTCTCLCSWMEVFQQSNKIMWQSIRHPSLGSSHAPCCKSWYQVSEPEQDNGWSSSFVIRHSPWRHFVSSLFRRLRQLLALATLCLSVLVLNHRGCGLRTVECGADVFTSHAMFSHRLYTHTCGCIGKIFDSESLLQSQGGGTGGTGDVMLGDSGVVPKEIMVVVGTCLGGGIVADVCCVGIRLSC